MIRFALLGLGIGGIYALASQGLILVYRGSGVLNFAQGALAAVGAFAYFDFHETYGLPTAPAVVLSLALCASLGVVIHYGVMRPLRTAPPLARVIATLGVMGVLQQFAYIRYGSQTRIVRSILPTRSVDLIHGNAVGEDRLVLLAMAVILSAVLWVVYRFTRFGLATTAVAENEQTAQLSGHSPSSIALTNWVAGCVLAGAAGILVAPISGLDVDNLVLLIIPALAAGLVGGFESFPLTLGASLIIGIIQAEMAKYVTTPGWSSSVPFLLVIAVLVVRGRSLPLRSHVNQRLPDIGSGLIRPRLVLALVAAATVVVLFHPNSWSDAVISTLLGAIICLSLVIVTGFAGQLSLAQFAFAGVAGYVATRLAAVHHVPFILACIIGIVAAVPIGIAIGLPALRTRGINLAIVTFGMAFAFQSVLFQSNAYTGGVQGTVVKPPSLLGWRIDAIDHPKRYAFAVFVMLLLALLVVRNVRCGRSGRRLIAVRSNERAAAALGISVYQAKLFAFAVSAAVAGMAGVLLAFRNTYVQYSTFDVFSSINAVILTVIGSMGYIAGAIIAGFSFSGGIVTRIVMELIKSGEVSQWIALLLAALLIVTLIRYPDGIASYLSHERAARARKKVARTESTATAEVVATLAALGDLSQHPQVPPRRLVVDDIHVRLGAVNAVAGISLTVEPAEVVGVMGANGAGKTTLIDAITGFTPITRGTVSLDDRRIDRLNARRRAELGISRSFQSLELFEEISVLENIRIAIEARQSGAYLADLFWPRTAELSETAVAAIRVLGLEGDLQRKPNELPFGRRRLVAIARAIAAEPSILLLDEPAAGLDEAESAELGELIRRLASEWGFGILLVEHDVSLLMRTCDRVVVVDFGAAIATGSPAAIRSDPKVIAAYLGEEPTGTDIDDADGVRR